MQKIKKIKSDLIKESEFIYKTVKTEKEALQLQQKGWKLIDSNGRNRFQFEKKRKSPNIVKVPDDAVDMTERNKKYAPSFFTNSIKKKSELDKCPKCKSEASYGGDGMYFCSNDKCNNEWNKNTESKDSYDRFINSPTMKNLQNDLINNNIKNKKTMLKISKSNQDIIQMFLEDSYPHSKEEAIDMGIKRFSPSYGTENLKIEQVKGKWSLVNYSTPLVINDNGTFKFNSSKYSVSTSKIQNYIRNTAQQLGIQLVEMQGGNRGYDAMDSGMTAIRKIKSELIKESTLIDELKDAFPALNPTSDFDYHETDLYVRYYSSSIINWVKEHYPIMGKNITVFTGTDGNRWIDIPFALFDEKYPVGKRMKKIKSELIKESVFDYVDALNAEININNNIDNLFNNYKTVGIDIVIRIFKGIQEDLESYIDTLNEDDNNNNNNYMGEMTAIRKIKKVDSKPEKYKGTYDHNNPEHYKKKKKEQEEDRERTHKEWQTRMDTID